MSVSAEALRKLSALRLDPDQMAGVLDILADIQTADETRKQGQRERTRRHRAQRDGNVTETLQNCYAPVPDKDKSPPPPKEINPTPDTSSLRSEVRAPAKPKTARPFRMPDDFFPDIDFAVSQGMTRSQAQIEAERMRDWSKSSKNGAKLDWHATWRGWVRRRLDESPPQRSQPQPRMTAHQQRHQTAIDAIDRKLGLKRNDDAPRFDIDLESADWRPH